MKRAAVDYRDFRLSRLSESRFSHLKLLIAWPCYFFMYFITERLIPYEACRTVYCPLDDLIPFCEVFVLPYVFWYGLIVFCLVYYALYDVDSFRKLMKYIIVTQVAAMLIYILLPNRQELRPESFPRENVFTALVGLIYGADTATNVCPSCHVAWSVGMASVWLKREEGTKAGKVIMLLLCILICMSTVFIKQHSFVDTLAALPVCMLAEHFSFHHKGRRPRRRRDACGMAH